MENVLAGGGLRGRWGVQVSMAERVMGRNVLNLVARTIRSSNAGMAGRAVRLRGGLVASLLVATVSFAGAKRSGSPSVDVIRGDAPSAVALPLSVVRAFPWGFMRRDGRTSRVTPFDEPIASAATPERAAGAWLRRHGRAIGVNASELYGLRKIRIGTGPLSLIVFAQEIGGVPVEGGVVHVVVHDAARRVVFVGARVAPSTRLPLRWGGVTAVAALRRARGLAEFARLTEWSSPELVVAYEPTRGIASPVRAWKIRGRSSEAAGGEAVTLFISASDSTLLDARDAVSRGAVAGVVTGLATPGTEPLMPGGSVVELAIPGVRMSASSGGTTFTDLQGAYQIAVPLEFPSDVRADLIGEWIDVHDAAGLDLSASGHAVRFDPETQIATLDLRLNDPATEFDTAQLNAFLHAHIAREFLLSRQSDLFDLDSMLTVNVNIGGGRSCAASFNSITQTMDFAASAPTCASTAYSTIVTHEYGHFVLNRLGFATPQGSFGEGFADALSVLVYDDALIGRDFNGPGVAVRDIEAANQQYPCLGGVHECGQVLAGVWWDMQRRMRVSLGSTPGLVLARQRFTDWSRVTMGGSGSDAAHPGTVVEVLTVDDNDGDLRTVPPHWGDICGAFADHNIPCPVSDCNGNGFDDRNDIDVARSDDCTENGIPDECEPDCDGNGLADSCDLAGGTVVDDDGNGVPDVCQRTLIVPSPDFATIQAAIDAAVPGDTVLVSPGIYMGGANKNLDYRGKVLVVACEAPGACVIDCEGSGRGFVFHSREDDRCVLDGFTIRNGAPAVPDDDGGAILCLTSSPTIRNCRLLDNAAGFGGGIHCHFASPRISNCVIAGNTARDSGGGIGLVHSNPTVRHCTIVANRERNQVSGIRGDSASAPIVENCIVWSDDRGNQGDLRLNPATATVSYTLSRGGFPGAGNIGGDPLFVSAATGDYRPMPGSPAINQGDPAASAFEGFDADGAPRPHGCRVDLGAHETGILQAVGDFNGDDRFDLSDVAALQLCFRSDIANPDWSEACVCVFDANGDARVDELDVAVFVGGMTGP